MTREVAIEGLKAFRREFSGYEPNEEMFGMAIKALEQEPFDNRPCISSKVCEHDKQNILDKIRAEIEKEADTSNRLYGISEIGLRKALKIIDKYKAESEDKG